MKKTYFHPTVKVAALHPCTTLLAGSNGWDTNYSSKINRDEVGDEDDFE